MTAQAPRSGRRRLALGSLALVALASWSLAVYFRVAPPRAVAGPDGESAARTSTGSDPPASSPPPVASSSTGQGAAPSGTSSTAAPAVTVSGSASALGAADDSTPEQVTACVSSLLTAGTLERARPSFSFVCGESHARQAATRIQAELSRDQRGTRGATIGMREWAVLGWYELAALAVFRGQCCASPKPLEWAFKLACPIDKALQQLEDAVRAHDHAGAEKATVQYTKTAMCLARQGQGPNFGQTGLPGPSVGTFKKLLKRLPTTPSPR